MNYVDGLNGSKRNCKSAPSWVYATKYWTASANYYSDVWDVYPDAYFGGDNFDNSGICGLRPVITISKSDI